jgi:DNA-binding ferritin-like protein (Dps family)
VKDQNASRSPVVKFLDLVIGSREQKRQWRAHVRRVKALPADYRLVMKQIEKFLWNYAADEQMMSVLEGILELFEEGAAEGRPVLDVTGQDVAEFALNTLAATQVNTWTGKKADELNAAVRKALGQKEA